MTSFVYLLTVKEYCHSGDPSDKEVVGVFNSKAAAVSNAGSMKAGYNGTPFDEAMEHDYDDCFTDNRDNAPDCGLLLQIGDDDHGEGDKVMLCIEKRAVQGTSTNDDEDDDDDDKGGKESRSKKIAPSKRKVVKRRRA
mmetsp:Transcript_50331/g.56994  ORF Transcript_50331/g.56994 Transcript_50331/m.56994 type:complete len:138 (+) Transcript_50331:32-445(+)